MMIRATQTDVLYRTGHPVLVAQGDGGPPRGSVPSFMQEDAEALQDAEFIEAMLDVGAQWVVAGEPLEIRRFTPGEDVLTLSFEPGNKPPKLAISQDKERPISHLLVNGKPILAVHDDAQDFSLEDVAITTAPPVPVGATVSDLESPLSVFPETRAALP